MISRSLSENLFDTASLLHEPTRDGFGRGLVAAGEHNEQVVAVCADLAESTRAHWFQEKFPERYVEVGVAEQNLATVASGLASVGKIPFILSYATFSPGRNNEQIRTTISLNTMPVKVVGCHAGVSVGPDGATHQALEDIALMRVQPRMTVVVPCDSYQAEQATRALAETGRPAYLRLAREKSPVFTTKDAPFEIGKSYVYFESSDPDVVILGCGSLVYHALVAAKELQDEGVEVTVINVPTIKPLDSDTIVSHVSKAGAVVTVEEHQVAGGFGSAISEMLAKEFPVPIEFIGIHDRFGQSGTSAELYQEYGLDIPSIKDAVKRVVRRKS